MRVFFNLFGFSLNGTTEAGAKLVVQFMSFVVPVGPRIETETFATTFFLKLSKFLSLHLVTRFSARAKVYL